MIVDEILKNIRYATIATASDDGRPWNAAVFYAYDDDKNLYWFSDTEAKHSKNIDSNHKAVISIYDSTAAEGEGVGLQIEASARRSEDTAELAEAIRTYNSFAKKFKLDISDLGGAAPTRMYCATPVKIWKNAEGERSGKYIDVRRRIDL